MLNIEAFGRLSVAMVGVAGLMLLGAPAAPAGHAPAGHAPAGQMPEFVWETSGFEKPESVLYHSASNAVFISNINGQQQAKDGNGYISKLTADGRIKKLKWVTGLDAPKGMAAGLKNLYVADIDQLVVIDIKKGEIIKRYPAYGAKFLNDVAIDFEGQLYVSDMMGNAIWRLETRNLLGEKEKQFVKWFENVELMAPNGLKVVRDDLLVASWGHLMAVNIPTKIVRTIDSGVSMSMLDGVEPIGRGVYLVTDRTNGGLLSVNGSGELRTLLKLEPGSADLGYNVVNGQILVPSMTQGVVRAFQVDRPVVH